MAAKTKEERARAKRVKKQCRAQAGLDRAEFFAEGGELARWRGIHLIQTDKKKRQNKDYCRKKVREA